MRKTLSLVLILFLCLSYAVASSLGLDFVKLSKTSPVFPTDKSIGKTADNDASDSNSWLAKILSEEFNFDWTENNFSETSAKALSAIYSEILSQHLPAKEFLMSVPLVNADSSTSIAVRFSDGTTLNFVISDNKIIGMSR